MTYTTRILSIADLLKQMDEQIEFLDALSSDEFDLNRPVYREVRIGINNSRRKLIYQFNGFPALAREVEIYSPRSLEDLKDEIEKNGGSYYSKE